MQESLPFFETSEVFVAGKAPTVTYNPRDDRHLEQEVRSYAAQQGKALSVSGPTKSGKTVLIERLLPPDRAIWVQGSDLASVDAFWRAVADALDAFDQISAGFDETESAGSEGSLAAGLPHAIQLKFGRSRTRSRTQSRSAGRTRPMPDLTREALQETPYPIIADDFHYVEQAVKKDIARAVKTLIGITHVILIAVPHEAFEAVRAEPDMDGRVWQLRIAHWSDEELKYIGREGFRALNIEDRNERVGTELARTSYGAPFLMQQLAYDYAISLDVRATSPTPVPAEPPEGWEQFFRRIADRSVPGVFDRLVRGPNPRGQERITRTLRDGRSTDIYGAILYGLSKIGARSSIRTSDLTRLLEHHFVENPPGRQQVASSLGHLRDIAREARGSGDPALDYKDDELHVLDPFLSFYLRYGSWQLPNA